MAGQTGYKNQWQTENKDRINFVVDKGKKDIIKSVADSVGESLNGYITKAVDERIERDRAATNGMEG